MTVLGLVLAGCGGGEDGPAGAAPATTPRPPATTATAPRAGPQSETQRVGDCLRKLGFRLTGGAPQTKGADTADFQIVLDSRRGGGYIGFYRNEARARRVAKQLRVNAARTKGAGVERHGAINIVWVDLSAPADRAGVRACLVS